MSTNTFQMGLTILAVLFACLAVSLLALGAAPKAAPAEDNTLAVSVAEHAGQLRVSWDPTEPAVRAADGLQVRSVDDGMIEFDRVTRKQLAGGMFLYNRKSTDVLLDMALEQNGRQTRRATVRYLSTPPVPQAARVP